MNKRCKAFPSEYQSEFTKRKIKVRQPYRPKLHWENEVQEISKELDESSEDLIKQFILDRLQSVYHIHFSKIGSGKKEQEEEIDLGNELIAYLKNLYYKSHLDKPAKLPLTSTRLFGYASPQTLRGQLSTYQDTYGRTGGTVILKNVQKMMAAKRRRIIQLKLQANEEL